MVPSRLSDSERAHLLDSSLAGSSRPFPVYDELSYDDFLVSSLYDIHLTTAQACDPKHTPPPIGEGNNKLASNGMAL
jgi:hypothetical protein